MNLSVAVRVPRGETFGIDIPTNIAKRNGGGWEFLKFPVNGESHIPLSPALLKAFEGTSPRIEAWETAWISEDGLSLEKVQIVSSIDGEKLRPFAIPWPDQVRRDGQMVRTAGFSYERVVVTTLSRSGELSVVELASEMQGASLRIPQRTHFKGVLSEFNPDNLPDFFAALEAAKNKLVSGEVMKSWYLLIEENFFGRKKSKNPRLH